MNKKTYFSKGLMQGQLFGDAEVVHEITVSYRKTDYSVPVKNGSVIRGSDDVAEFLRKNVFVGGVQVTDVEYFGILYVSRAGQVYAWSIVSKGGLAGTVADVRVIFSNALVCRATAIVAFHNHPSGNPEPSESDKRLTKRLKEAGNALDVALLDHIVLTEDGHYSFEANNNL